jgi:hypothetical protein
MKTNLILVIVQFFLFGLQSTFGQQKFKYDLPIFDELSVRNNAVVYLRQDTVQSVLVEGNEAFIDQVFVESKDGKLVIRYATDKRIDTKFKPDVLTFHISVLHMKRILVSGSGAVNAEGTIRGDELSLYVSGSGSIQLPDVNAKNIHSSLSGSGHIDISSNDTIPEHKIVISGSGKINSGGLKSKYVGVIMSGSGNCTVDASEKLSVRIAGSGKVTYHGNPVIQSTTIGPGKLIKAE